MGGIPYLGRVVCTLGEKIFLKPGAGVPGYGRWIGIVEPMIRQGVRDEARGMRKNHPDRDRVIRIIRVSESKGEIQVDVVIQVKQSLFIELHEGGASDGLGDGGDDVDGLGSRWFVCFDVGESVSFLPDDRGIVDDAGGHAWVMADVQ